MSTSSRSEWFTSTRTASLSQVLTITSPAKLLTLSFVPFATCTVWSVVVTAIIARSSCAIMKSPWFSVRFGERRRAAQKIQLPPPRLDEVPAQVRVGGIGRQRVARLRNRLVDDLQVVLDDLNRRFVQPAASVLHGPLEIRHGGVVLRVGEADGRHDGGRDQVRVGPRDPCRPWEH